MLCMGSRSGTMLLVGCVLLGILLGIDPMGVSELGVFFHPGVWAPLYPGRFGRSFAAWIRVSRMAMMSGFVFWISSHRIVLGWR